MPGPNSSAAQAETKTFTVAKGRTISHDGAPGQDTKHFGPGDKVDLPIAEGERLQKLGFFLFDDGTSLVPTNGPATEAGVEIREVE